jgi:LppX_LprAFG lipoprotein
MSRRRVIAGAVVTLASLANAALPGWAAETGGAAVAAATAKPVKLPDIAKATAAPRTFQFSMTTLVSFAFDDQSIGGKITAVGSVDEPRGAASSDMDVFDYVKALATVQGRPLPKDLSDPMLFRVKVVSLGSTLWVNLPMLNKTVAQAASKPWTSIDTATVDVSAGDVLAAQGADPGDGLRFIQGLSPTATEAGKERVRGVDTTRYNGTIDFDRLLKVASDSDVDAVRSAFESRRTIPMSIWIDSDARARRLDVTIETNGSEATGNVDVRLTTVESYEYFAFDEPASITVPSASQVGDNPAVRAAITRMASNKRR